MDTKRISIVHLNSGSFSQSVFELERRHESRYSCAHSSSLFDTLRCNKKHPHCRDDL